MEYICKLFYLLNLYILYVFLGLIIYMLIVAKAVNNGNTVLYVFIIISACRDLLLITKF